MEIYNANQIKKAVLLLSFFGALFFSAGADLASAATLYLTPSSGTYKVGQSFTVRVAVNSQDVAMNAASGIISFPREKLEVLSVSKTGSVMNLWVQEPGFNNTLGTIDFEGIAFNPGFQSDAGRVISVTFKAKQAGSATVSFSSGSVLANDGQGTNILNGFTNATYGIQPSVPSNEEAGQSTTPAPVPTGSLAAPQVSSPTHPNPDKWYDDNNPKFLWNLPSGSTAVRLLWGDLPQSTPNVVYEPAISERVVAGVPDGTWYFHVQLKGAGGWGSVAHYRFQVDTTPPDKFTIEFADASDKKNPRPSIYLRAKDSLSGIDHYRIKAGNSDPVDVPVSVAEAGPYAIPAQGPGTHSLTAQAFDKAGNYEVAVTEYSIESIDPPYITDYSRSLRSGDFVTVRGKTYPNSEVEVFLSKSESISYQFLAKSDANGSFTAMSGNDVDLGAYKMWATVTDSRGAKSLPTNKLDVYVQQSNILKIGSLVVNALTIVVSFAGMVLLLILMFFYGRKKVREIRKSIEKDVQATSKNIHRGFDILRARVGTHIRTLEKVKSKRELTKEEDKILVQLKNDMDRIEEEVEAQVEKIEKDIK